MKDNVNIVILPLYRNKESSPYDLFNCYKDNPNTLDLSYLEHSLLKLSSLYSFNNVSIEGGEISELSDLYFDLLFNLVKLYTNKVIIHTNFIEYNPSLINRVDIINVNLNFDKYQTKPITVKNNIKAAVEIGKIVNVNSLDIRLGDNELENIVTLNRLGIKSWKITPYHQSGDNPKQESYAEFEKKVKTYIDLAHYMHFSFINKLELEGVINNHNFPVRTIYITPNNKFGVGSFDEESKFSIVEFDDLDSLEKFLKNQQRDQILACEGCNYHMNCLADRFFNPHYVGKSCSGFKDLIKTMEGK